LEADQRALPAGDRFARQGQEFLRLLHPERLCETEKARDLWLRVCTAGGYGSLLYAELDPDAEYVLSTLSKMGCKLIAASNSDGTLKDELKHFSLTPLFDFIVDSHDIGVEKPDQQFFSHVLSLIGEELDQAETWYVGNDVIRDILGSLMAGFNRAVLYDRADAYPDFRNPNRLTKLRDLVPLVSSQRT
jgi:FMN phosphatase YigB (HAD superfamily)